MTQYTTQEAIDIALTQSVLNSAIDKTDSTVPDSIGDKLFSMKLKLSWYFTHHSKIEVFEIITKAKELLASQS